MASSMPGIGSTVIYYQGSGGSGPTTPIPAVVLLTHDTWQSGMVYGSPQPAPDQVYLGTLNAGNPAYAMASEGSSPGQFSRVSAVATAVFVPDI